MQLEQETEIEGACEMNQKYIVRLTAEDRSYLEGLLQSGSLSVRMFKKVFILLQSDQSAQGPGWTYEQISAAYHVSQMLVTETLKKYVEKGLPDAISQETEPGVSQCDRWRSRSAFDRHGLQPATRRACALDTALVTGSDGGGWLRGVGFARDHPQGDEKNELKPWLKEQWCIPPEADAAFVCQMEDVFTLSTFRWVNFHRIDQTHFYPAGSASFRCSHSRKSGRRLPALPNS
jgi:hypothetical protein